MSESPKKSRDRLPNSAGNLYWIYAIILLFILISFYLLPDKKNEREITETEFWDDYVSRDLVLKVNIVNTNNTSTKLVEVYLTPEALQQEQFRKYATRNFLGTANAAFTFKVVSTDDFVKDLKSKKVHRPRRLVWRHLPGRDPDRGAGPGLHVPHAPRQWGHGRLPALQHRQKQSLAF